MVPTLFALIAGERVQAQAGGDGAIKLGAVIEARAAVQTEVVTWSCRIEDRDEYLCGNRHQHHILVHVTSLHRHHTPVTQYHTGSHNSNEVTSVRKFPATVASPLYPYQRENLQVTSINSNKLFPSLAMLSKVDP